jgi:hypothetical protein
LIFSCVLCRRAVGKIDSKLRPKVFLDARNPLFDFRIGKVDDRKTSRVKLKCNAAFLGGLPRLIVS